MKRAPSDAAPGLRCTPTPAFLLDAVTAGHEPNAAPPAKTCRQSGSDSLKDGGDS